MKTIERDRAFARDAKFDLGVMGTAPDVTALWGAGDWQGYAEQLEDDLRHKCRSESRRWLLAGTVGFSITLTASVVIEFFAR